MSEREAERYLNAACVLAPDGAITAVYEKERLLPFAECFPFAWAGGLQRRFVRVSTSGPSGMIDPLGHVHEASPTASRAVLAGAARRELPRASGRPPHAGGEAGARFSLTGIPRGG